MKLLRGIIYPSLKLLGPTHQRRGIVLVPLLLIQSLLDVVSVASFAPMALIIVRPEGLSAYPVLQNLLARFPSGDQRVFALTWIVSIGIFFLLKQGVSAVITRFKARYVFDVAGELSDTMLDRFMGLPYEKYHDLESSHELIKITQLPVSFANNILLSLSTLFTEGLILLLLLATLAWYDWRSIIFLLIFICPAVVYYRINRKRLHLINDSMKMDYPALIQRALQVIDNFVDINLYQKRAYFKEKVQQLNQKLNTAHVSQTMLQANSFRVFETTAAIGLCVLVVYTILSGSSAGATVMLLGLYTAAGFRAVPSFNRIFVALLDIKSNEHVLTGLIQLNRVNPSMQTSSPVSFENSLALQNLTFAFPNKRPILEALNLTIRKGQKVALTGPSGSGKTTLLLIIMRFLKESEGEMRVDGLLLDNKHTSSWRSHLAYVSQHPVILDGTIVENVAFGMDPLVADTEKITELLQLLGLGPWLQQLRDGLMSRFGERGIRLSGGQRQRIAIARALYLDTDILLLDEATSQLDAVTEKEVHLALQATGYQNKTLIMVTHRDSSLHFFDRIYELGSGQIRQVGTEAVPA